MNEYTVYVTETLTHRFDVLAATKEEAEQEAHRQYDRNDYESTALPQYSETLVCDFDGTEAEA